MLSDGAGAVVISSKPKDSGLSLRIDWIDIVSYANEVEACMYYGAAKQEDGSLIGYRSVQDDHDLLLREGYMNLAQDVGLLRAELPKYFREAVLRTHKRRTLKRDEIDWLLPHYSSEGFREPLYNALAAEEAEIPIEKWFTNLKWKGNTGAASIYIMIDELIASGRAAKGQRILCAIPESARFTFSIMHLTVV
jgi:3-oxoacyl-[acyl-carrier-protein] synthase-3